MKWHTTDMALLTIVTLMGILCIEGAANGVHPIIEAKGSAYVRLRNAAVADQEAWIEAPVAALPEERLLYEIVSERRSHPEAFGHYVALVAEDRLQQEGLSPADLRSVTNTTSRLAPLAYTITQAIKRQSTDDGRRRVALAVEEHFWKLAESEYEQYNTLVAMVALAQIGLLNPAISNEVIRVTQNTDSPRVAEVGLRLIHLQGRSVSPNIVSSVWQKHKSSAQVNRLCRALLNEQKEIAAAMEVLRAIDEDRKLQAEAATTKRRMPGKKILSTDGVNYGHAEPLEQ